MELAEGRVQSQALVFSMLKPPVLLPH